MSKISLDVRLILFPLIFVLVSTSVGSCSMFGSHRAALARLEEDIVAIGAPISTVDASFRLDGFARELNVFVTVDGDTVSGELLSEVINVIDDHRDNGYVTGILQFSSVEGKFISIKSVALDIGLQEKDVISGAFSFTRNSIYHFVEQS